MSIKKLEVHAGENVKVEEDPGLYKILDELPKPNTKMQLTAGQRFWWYWFGYEFVKTKQISQLDLTHLQKAAFWMDARSQAYKEIKKRGYAGGMIQVFNSGAVNTSPHLTIVEKSDKALEDVSAHFGLSIKDRKKLGAGGEDPDQLDLFASYLQKKTN